MGQKIVVGLGNPGKEFENTYHNVGFLALDRLAAIVASAAPDAAPWQKYKILFEYKKSGHTTFIKPLTYMNDSGKAVREALKKFGGTAEDLIVIHDDSDLTVGNYKISFGRSSAGHKGVQSIIDALKTNQFQRIRIGIRPAREKQRQKAGEFALKPIPPAHRKILDELLAGIIERHLENIHSPVLLKARNR
jgi:peptidyl-tRNA hydrolase, PTH1 family